MSTSISKFGLMAIAMSLGVMCSDAHAVTYNLDLDNNGSFIQSVGSVTITPNFRRDTLTYRVNLTNGARLMGVFLDAGAGGIAPHDLGPVTNSLGTFTDSFHANGRRFTVTFRHTDVANSSIGLHAVMYAAVLTTKGLFGDGLALDPPVNDPPFTPQGDPPAATPIPPAIALFSTGLGALGLLGWRRKRKALAAA